MSLGVCKSYPLSLKGCLACPRTLCLSTSYERFGRSLPHYTWVAKVYGAPCCPIAAPLARKSESR